MMYILKAITFAIFSMNKTNILCEFALSYDINTKSTHTHTLNF